MKLLSFSLFIMVLMTACNSRSMDFPVFNRIEDVQGNFTHEKGKLIAEERVAIYNIVDSKTQITHIKLVIEYKEHFYVFVGEANGILLILKPDGIDGFKIIQKSTWSGDPLTKRLQAP